MITPRPMLGMAGKINHHGYPLAKAIMIRSTVLFLSLIATACDTGEAPECPQVQSDAKLQIVSPVSENPESIEFRNPQDAWNGYIQHWDGQTINTKQFISALEECEQWADPTWLLTLSGYAQNAADDTRVMGLGGSAIVHHQYWDCLRDTFIKYDAVVF